MTPIQHHDKRRAKGMSARSELMLDLLREMLADGLQCEVMECNNRAIYREIGSRAAVYKAMKWLLDNRYVILKKSERDARARIFTISHKGTEYLADDLTGIA
jgi:hypothetical protein